jgi:hypothetical protein
MPMQDFIITVYCMVDEISSKKIFQELLWLREFALRLSDSKIIAMEIIGEPGH